MAQVDESSPIYLQLREVVRDRIDTGQYRPGTAIPSENALAEIYGVNRLTVRSALDALVEEGLLKRVQGKGVFVTKGRMTRDLDTLTGFHQAIEGAKSSPQVKMLAKGRRKAGSVFAKRLEIDRNDDIFYVKRLNLANDMPVSLEYLYIPAEMTPTLMDVDLDVFTLYDVYSFSGCMPERAWQTLDIVSLEPRIARAIGCEPERDGLLFTCTSYCADGRPVEFMRSYNRPDACSFTVENGAR